MKVIGYVNRMLKCDKCRETTLGRFVHVEIDEKSQYYCEDCMSSKYKTRKQLMTELNKLLVTQFNWSSIKKLELVRLVDNIRKLNW